MCIRDRRRSGFSLETVAAQALLDLKMDSMCSGVDAVRWENGLAIDVEEVVQVGGDQAHSTRRRICCRRSSPDSNSVVYGYAAGIVRFAS